MWLFLPDHIRLNCRRLLGLKNQGSPPYVSSVCKAFMKIYFNYVFILPSNLNTFLPEASFGLRVLSLPACVRVSVNHELISAITRHNFQLKSPNWDQKMQNILLKVPIVLGTDWA